MPQISDKDLHDVLKIAIKEGEWNFHNLKQHIRKKKKFKAMKIIQPPAYFQANALPNKEMVCSTSLIYCIMF